MSELISHIPLREVFVSHLKVLEAYHPSEARLLAGELMAWGSSIADGENLNLWGHIEQQINYQVGLRNQDSFATSPEDFVEYMFSPNSEDKISADVIMARLQTG